MNVTSANPLVSSSDTANDDTQTMTARCAGTGVTNTGDGAYVTVNNITEQYSRDRVSLRSDLCHRCEQCGDCGKYLQ